MRGKKLIAFSMAFVAIGIFGVGTIHAQMKKPEMVTITGTLIDTSCAAKGMAMMGSDYNAKNDTHKTPDGDQPSCATMCLKGGQPAGLYDKGKIVALLLADASQNLYEFAAKTVEVQGWWAGEKDDDVKTFFPEKIRLKGTKDWATVKTSEMHS